MLRTSVNIDNLARSKIFSQVDVVKQMLHIGVAFPLKLCCRVCQDTALVSIIDEVVTDLAEPDGFVNI